MTVCCETDDGQVTIESVEDVTVIQILEGSNNIIVDGGEGVLIEELITTNIIEDTTPNEILTECRIGPRGPKGDDGTAAEQVNAVVVQADTGIIDTVALSSIRSVKWLVTVTDEVNNVHRYSEVAAIQDGTNVRHVHTNKIGDWLPYTVNVILFGGLFFQLEMTNNHSEDLKVSVLRLATEIAV